MATSGYVGETQPASLPQGGPGVSMSSVEVATSTTTTTQYLAEIQTSPTASTPGGTGASGEAQSPTIDGQKPAVQAPQTAVVAQTQYVTAEIQGSPTQTGHAQSTPQYIVVTVTGKARLDRLMYRSIITHSITPFCLRIYSSINASIPHTKVCA